MTSQWRTITLALLLGTTAACSPAKDESANIESEVVNVAEPAEPDPAAENVTEAASAANDSAANATAEADAKKAEEAKKAEDEKKKKEAEAAKAKTAEETKVAAAAPVEPPASFGRCAVCHDVTKGGPNKLGPNLFGTYGKTAGVHNGFAYSDALKGSGLKWDDATLDKWLDNPRALVVGNRMSFPGLKDPAKRQEIIDFLKSLK